MSLPRVAVLGAGPIGLETALYAARLGHPVTVFEAGPAVAEHMRRWGHVRLFTPWELDVSPLGAARLRETGLWDPGPDPDTCPTGAELAATYLEPLADLPELRDGIRLQHRVVSVGRDDLLKGEAIGDATRGARSFTLLVDTPDGERLETADIVVDATGVFGHPNAIGRGGIPAPGERAAADRILTGVPDVLDAARDRVANKHVLVVGGGLSAATTMAALAGAGANRVTWATRSGAPPLTEIPDDPLPSRSDLIRHANRIASEPPAGFRHVGSSSVTAMRMGGGRVEVVLDTPGGPETVLVDTVIAQTGFHPDTTLYRELQVHQCYASEGPMKLAAALLGAGSADCMTQAGHGADTLRNPEPGFFLVGNKSYGRNSAFLLRVGRDQVRDVFRIVSGRAELDLYAEEAAGAR